MLTNATKANLNALLVALFGLLTLLDVLSPEVGGAIILVVEALFVFVVGLLPGPLNYKSSPKRINDSG